MVRILGASVPLLCIFWHLVTSVLTIVNYVVYFRNNFEGTPTISTAYLAFSIIGLVAYGAVAGPMFLFAYKYGKTYQTRTSNLNGGISVMAFFSSLPILLIEMIATLQLGEMTNILDTVVFVLQAIGSLVGMTIGWIAYLRFVSRNLQQFRGPERQIVDENTELPTRTTQIIMVTPVRGQPTHI